MPFISKSLHSNSPHRMPHPPIHVEDFGTVCGNLDQMGLMALRAMREASLSRSPGYLNKEMPDDSGTWSCYVLPTVQPGTAMTVKEMGLAVATRQAFSVSILRQCRITYYMVSVQFGSCCSRLHGDLTFPLSSIATRISSFDAPCLIIA